MPKIARITLCALLLHMAAVEKIPKLPDSHVEHMQDTWTPHIYRIFAWYSMARLVSV